ncbi:MAG: GAF domain-containing protein [Cyanophyceae cyanobacterium]
MFQVLTSLGQLFSGQQELNNSAPQTVDSWLNASSQSRQECGDHCRHVDRGQFRRRRSGRTATALVVLAASFMSVLARPTSAQLTNEPLLAQSQTESSEITAESENLIQPPIVLWGVLTVVAALLLVGLVATFLAYRGIRQVKSEPDKDKHVDEDPDVFSELSAQLEEFPPDSQMAASEPMAAAPTLPKEAPESFSTKLLTYADTSSEPDKLLEQQEEAAELAQIVQEISLRLRRTQYLEELLRVAVKEVRRALKTDRVLIYGLDSTNWEGLVVAESVAPEWPKTLRVRIDDPCFRDSHVEMYKHGRVRVIENVYQEPGLGDCYIRMLEQFAVKAEIIAPVMKNKQLLGLLIAHHCSEPRNWQKAEIELFSELATQIGFSIEEVSFLEQQEEEAERVQLVTEIILRLRRVQHMEELLKVAVKEVRRALNTDRVLIYGLDPTNWEGVVVAESVASGWPQTLKVKIDDPCLGNGLVEMYKNGRVRAIDDIYQEPGLSECYIRTVEQFAVKAQLVAPILKNNQLLGLMMAHHCSEPRNWQKAEIDLFSQLATQVGFTVDQVNLIEQTERSQSYLKPTENGLNS